MKCLEHERVFESEIGLGFDSHGDGWYHCLFQPLTVLNKYQQKFECLQEENRNINGLCSQCGHDVLTQNFDPAMVYS